MKKTKLALFAAGLSLASASVFATNCSDFVAGPNKAAAKYIATVGTGAYKDLYFNRKGNFTMDKSEVTSSNVDFIIKSYTLPTDVSKKIVFRFVRAETMGTRTANRRLVCKFIYEFNDGFVTGSDFYILDVEPTSDYNNITAYYGPGEPASGGLFDPRVPAQRYINSAIFKAIREFPEYKTQMEKFN